MSKVNIMAKVIEIAEKRDKQVELSKEQIELAIPDDLSKQTSELKSLIKEFEVNGKATEKAYNDLKSLAKQAATLDKNLNSARKALIKTENKEDKINSKIDKLYSQMEKAASGLGIKLQDIKGFKAWDEADKALVKMGQKYVSSNFYIKD